MKYIYDQINMKEHLECSICHKLMIKRMSSEIDLVIDGRPVKEWTYWCNCGNIVTGGVIVGVPELEYIKKEWERVNNIGREDE